MCLHCQRIDRHRFFFCVKSDLNAFRRSAPSSDFPSIIVLNFCYTLVLPSCMYFRMAVVYGRHGNVEEDWVVIRGWLGCRSGFA